MFPKLKKQIGEINPNKKLKIMSLANPRPKPKGGKKLASNSAKNVLKGLKKEYVESPYKIDPSHLKSQRKGGTTKDYYGKKKFGKGGGNFLNGSLRQ